MNAEDDLRAAVLGAVRARQPVDARERGALADFIERFTTLADPFDEHAGPVHVTASALVTGRRGVVLHRHKRLGIWLQPGGHIDPGEMPWDAARREAAEETGLTVHPLGDPTAVAHVDVHPGPRGHTHLDLRYHLVADDAEPDPPAGESQEVSWFPWARAVDVADAGLEGALRAAQPGTPLVRPVRHGDAAGCAAVYLRSRAFALAGVPLVHTPAEVRRWMADEVVGPAMAGPASRPGGGRMWVADLDGVICGLLVVDADDRPGDGRRGGARRGWVDQLYLDPSWIGRGIGGQLVEVAKHRCPGGLSLWTFQNNHPARRFYARHGFTEVELTDGAGNEERSPDVRLVWSP